MARRSRLYVLMINVKRACRTLFRTPFVTVIASPAPGIGANAAIVPVFQPDAAPGVSTIARAPGPTCLRVSGPGCRSSRTRTAINVSYRALINDIDAPALGSRPSADLGAES